MRNHAINFEGNQMIISLASGSFWRSFRNKNGADALQLVQKLPVKGVELTLGKKDQFERFHLRTFHKKLLQKFDYVSVHAPFRSAKSYQNPEEHEKDLSRIKEIVEESSAQTIVFHPHYLPNKKILKKFRFNIAVENMEKRKKVPLQRLATLMQDYKTGFCLDTSHAYEYGAFRTAELLRRFKPKLLQIHLSANYRHHNHRPLTRASLAFLKSIEPIKDTNVPVILEENFSGKSLSLAKKEIEWARAFFGEQK